MISNGHLFLLTLGLIACYGQKTTSEEKVNASVVASPVSSDTVDIIRPNGMTIAERFNPPAGFVRTDIDSLSFGFYLRNLPLKLHGEQIYLYNGQLKFRQDVHAAVIDVDVGSRDLQQCADAVIRLRAEFLFKQKMYDDIHFNYTNGFNAAYSKWKEGYRIRVEGNNVDWILVATPSAEYGVFRDYLQQVFMYAGTLSLSQELKPVPVQKVSVGNVFIQGGSPGHAVLIVDECTHTETGEKLFLLAQSYMPAQDVHVLKNPNDPAISPWYSVPNQGELKTPEWTFMVGDLKRF